MSLYLGKLKANMTDSILSQLKEAADKALKCSNAEESVKHLAKAFSLFSQETSRLELAYSRLQERFNIVSEELDERNEELYKKVGELNKLSNYLKTVLKHVSQGILFIDSEGIITICNDSALKIVGKEKLELCKFADHFPDDFFGFSMQRALKFGIAVEVNYIVLRERRIEVSSTFLASLKESIGGVIIVLRDITDMHKLQTIANRNDRMKALGEMAASVAHEIRNPLGGIRGYASLLFRGLESDTHLQEMAKNIIEGTKVLERLLGNILNFSRPVDVKLEFYDVVSLVRDVCKLLKADSFFPEERIKLHLHFSQEKIFVPLDKELLKTALLNLLVNAVQAIEKNGTITLSILQNNSNCAITISDTGEGIEAKNLENIFLPFFTTKKGGNGLGLAESYKIIQAHFGSISVQSQLRMGTTFTIILPLKR